MKIYKSHSLNIYYCCCYFFLFLIIIACSDNDGEEFVPNPPAITQAILNAGFEEDNSEVNTPKGWTVTGDNAAVSVVKGGCEGSYALFYSYTSAYTVSTWQTISDLEDGNYDLEFYYKNSGGQSACYISAGSTNESQKMTSLQVAPHVWVKSIVRGIHVQGGKCTISIFSEGQEGDWSRFDALRLNKVEKDYNLLKGGDLSELSYLEQMGGKFYENGEEKDVFDILKNNGFNIARLRLYNDPGNPNYSPSNRLPAGVQNPADILNLSKRAKAAGMQIMLTIHYSDYWSNGEIQYKPHEWEDLSYEALKKAVYDFTFDFITKMKAQGSVPEYVALGNETGSGLLFPDGAYHTSPTQMAELFNQGYDAVKAVSPESTVLIHLNDAGNRSTYDWYFGELNKYGAKYDMIGASYYPFWTQKTAKELREWADYTSKKFDKEIFIMETGYNWNPTLPNGYPGQLSDNGPYQNIYPSSPQGQKDFLLELFNEIKKTENGCIVGCLYWDPIMIEVPGVGWELGGTNIVSNTTLFDFSGNALESLNTFKYNN